MADSPPTIVAFTNASDQPWCPTACDARRAGRASQTFHFNAASTLLQMRCKINLPTSRSRKGFELTLRAPEYGKALKSSNGSLSCARGMFFVQIRDCDGITVALSN
jgi:hypothetical protein